MPSSICCTNCRTKYSLLNREGGCSNCALSFCKKCLSYRALLPNLSDSPLTVCYDCYKKLEEKKVKSARDDVVITSTPLPPNRTPSNYQNPKNWWGEGLPPPSFRGTYTEPPRVRQPKPASNYPVLDNNTDNEEDKKLEERMKQLKSDKPEPAESMTTEQLEERLARLRGCDVELIRNPKSWFAGDKKKGELGNTNNVADLMKMAEDRAKLEEMEEEMERKEMEELEERRNRLREGGESGAVNDPNRESMISGYSDYSMATQEQMQEINQALQDAESKVAETKKREADDAAELRKVMTATRQKSLDAMQWNDQITKEIGGFWDRQNDKLKCEEDDEDEKSIDEETFKKILKEAEDEAENDVEPPAQLKKVSPQNASPSEHTTNTSPKKKGFFDKFFRRDSKS